MLEWLSLGSNMVVLYELAPGSLVGFRSIGMVMNTSWIFNFIQRID
jgi:hypothetical protein